MDKPLWQLLCDIEKKYVEKPAFLYYERKGTVSVKYDDFIKDVRQKAYAYSRIPEKRIGIWGYNSYQWIVSAFALLLSGKHLIMYDANLTDSNFIGLVEYSDTEALLVAPDLTEDAKGLFSELPIYSFFDFAQETEIKDEDIVEKDFMCFTSGTSQNSKGVVIDTRALGICTRMAEGVLPGEKGEKYFLPLPFHHIYGFTEILHILYRGGSICLGNGVRYIQKDMDNFLPEVAFFVPTMLQYLLSKGHFPASLHAVLTGGSYCRPEYEVMMKGYGIELYNLYGLSETLGMICSSTKRNGIQWLKPFGSVKFELSDEGEVGIYLPFHMKEYYNKKEDTLEVLQGDFFWTGDAGEMDAEGCVQIKGRKRDTIVLGNGEKLYAEDIDRELSELPGICEAAAIVHRGYLIAVLVPASDFDENILSEAWRELNKNKMVSQRIQKIWIHKKSLPRTTTGKLKRFQVIKEYEETVK